MTLPHVMSKLIRIGLADLEKVENDERYVVNMETWHVPGKRTCAVCFAGSVMAKTMEVDLQMWVNALSFGEENGRAFSALDALRMGDVQLAAYSLDIPGNFESVSIRAYNRGPSEFVQDMTALATTLEGMGL